MQPAPQPSVCPAPSRQASPAASRGRPRGRAGLPPGARRAKPPSSVPDRSLPLPSRPPGPVYPRRTASGPALLSVAMPGSLWTARHPPFAPGRPPPPSPRHTALEQVRCPGKPVYPQSEPRRSRAHPSVKHRMPARPGRWQGPQRLPVWRLQVPRAPVPARRIAPPQAGPAFRPTRPGLLPDRVPPPASLAPAWQVWTSPPGQPLAHLSRPCLKRAQAPALPPALASRRVLALPLADRLSAPLSAVSPARNRSPARPAR